MRLFLDIRVYLQHEGGIVILVVLMCVSVALLKPTVHLCVEKQPHFWSIWRMSKIEELIRCYLTSPSQFEREATLKYDTRCISNLWTAPKDANSINMAHSDIEGGDSKKT
jgi:hypothetical protein